MIIKSGEFDLRGYEVARTQSFASATKTSVSLSKNVVRFSSACIRQFVSIEYIEMQVHPDTHELVVLPHLEYKKGRMCWARVYADSISVRAISASAFGEALFEIFGWDTDKRYRLRGEVVKDENGAVAFFDAKKPEIFTSRYDMTMPWAIGFGDDYYEYRASQNRDDLTNVSFSEYNDDPDLQPTTQEEAAENIQMLIEQMKNDGRYSDASTDILY